MTGWKGGAKVIPHVEQRQFKNITGFRRQDGSVVGFHAENLEVATLNDQAWQELGLSPSVSAEIIDWSLQSTLKQQEPLVQNSAKLRSLTINVTQVCNLQCKYCAAGGDGSYGEAIKRISVDDTIESLNRLMNGAPAGKSFRITFLGGEPLLYPKGIELLANEALRLGEKKNLDVRFSIVTNGTLFSFDTIALLKRFKMDITVSLDGPAEINDLRRPTRSGRSVTAEIEKGLAELLPHKPELGSVMISGVFGKGNLDLVRAYEYYRSIPVSDWFDFTFDHTETSAEISSEFTAQLKKVAALAYQTGGEKELRRIHTFDRWIATLDLQKRVENYCGAGKSFLIMDASQNLFICPWMIGDSKEQVGTKGEVWNSKLVSLEKPLVELNGCQNCFARYLCGGGCMYAHMHATGDKHKVDEIYCDRTRNLIAETILYYEQMRGSNEKGESYVRN